MDGKFMKVNMGSCNGWYLKIFYSIGFVFSVNVDYMDVNYIYVFELVVMKDWRVMWVFYNLIVILFYIIFLM